MPNHTECARMPMTPWNTAYPMFTRNENEAKSTVRAP